MSRMALAPGRAREYETIYILRPDIDKDTADSLSSRLAEAIKNEKGRLTVVELWGRRRLAYEISGHRRGVYVYFKYLGRGNVVTELERQLRLADSVLRYQTIQVSNDVAIDPASLTEPTPQLEFDVPPIETEEPDMTRERELGLDAPFADRGGRARRERRDEDGEEIFDGEEEHAAWFDDDESGAKSGKEG